MIIVFTHPCFQNFVTPPPHKKNPKKQNKKIRHIEIVTII